MKKLILIAALVLSGCVVTPYPREYAVRPVAEPVVYWEPSVQLWFWYGQDGRRHYQPRDWRPHERRWHR